MFTSLQVLPDDQARKEHILIGLTESELQAAVHGAAVIGSLAALDTLRFHDAAVVLIVELQNPTEPERRTSLDTAAEQARTEVGAMRILALSLEEEDTIRFLKGASISIDNSPTFPGNVIHVRVAPSEEALGRAFCEDGFSNEPFFINHVDPIIVQGVPG